MHNYLEEIHMCKCLEEYQGISNHLWAVGMGTFNFLILAYLSLIPQLFTMFIYNCSDNEKLKKN
jgi:hypothetical protein